MDKDKKRSKVGTYFLNIALAVDQFGSALRGWDYDETISSMLGKLKKHYGKDFKKERPFAYALAKALNRVDEQHVEDAIETDEGKNSVVDTHISFVE